MPPKVPIAIISKATISGGEDTNIVDSSGSLDLQVVTIRELREIIKHINNNTQALDNKVNEIGISKVKLLSIEWFDSTKLKLKGFLSQIRFKII